MVFIEQTEPLSLDKNIVVTSGFNGSSVNTIILHHVFSLDGNVTVGDDNDVLIMDCSKFAFEGSICKLYYDETAQQVKYTFSLGEYFIDIIFDFVINPIKVKITIIGSLAQPLTVKLPVSTSNVPYTNGINIFSNNIGFDWSDIVSGQDGCIGVSWNNTKTELTLNLDTTFEIDPSTIASFSIYYTLGGVGSHMLVYASGRYWVFLSSTEYYTSTDGVNWSSATTLHSGYKLRAIWYNGIRLDLVYSDGNLYYESLTLNSNGTVTSLSSGLKPIFTTYNEYDFSSGEYFIEYTYFVDDNDSFGTTQICIDSNNRPWVTFVLTTITAYYDWNTYELVDGYQSPANEITTSTYTDGSNWQTQTPYPLSFGSYNSGYSLLTPLTNGKVAVAHRYMYAGSNQIKMLIYDVTNSLIREAIKLNESSSNHASIVSVGDDVYITDYVYSGGVYYIGCIKYTYENNTYGTWTSISGNTSSLNTAVPPSITKDTSNNLYIFWASVPTTDHIYYRKMNANGTWDSIVDWKNNTSYATIMNIQQMGYGTFTATCPTNSGTGNPAVAWIRYAGTTTLTCYFDELVLFPPQFGGFKMRTSSGTVELCMVARGNGNPNITDKLRTQKGSTIYDLYLVETSDINASSVHIKTSQGIKAIRKKT